MFGSSSGFNYETIPQGEHGHRNTPGLFTSGQSQYNSGFSFDYVPKIKNNDFTDESQGVVSRLCNLVVIFLVFLCTLVTFPISAWFVLKVSSFYILNSSLHICVSGCSVQVFCDISVIKYNRSSTVFLFATAAHSPLIGTPVVYTCLLFM